MISILAQKESTDKSIKYIFSNQNRNKFEAIYFNHPERKIENKEPYHICISTQAGCAMACTFCATGHGGFFENLNVDSMLEQIYLIKRNIEEKNLEHSENYFNVVLMGMGEPLMNYNNVVKFLYKANKEINNLKNILISTIGIGNRIIDLADHQKNTNIRLYLSVHSPYEDERKIIMPITKKFSLDSSIKACEYYSDKTKTLVKATYLLLKGVNDSETHAKALASILDPNKFIIQVLLYNQTPGIPYERPSEEIAKNFENTLIELGYNAYIRTSRGRDINAGCGQFIQAENAKKIKI